MRFSPSAAGRLLAASLLAAAVPLSAQAPQPAAPPAPIVNWRVPSFTSAGLREWTVSGSEATQLDGDRAAVKEINVTVYSLDEANRADTIFLSPDAMVELERKLVTGQGTVRVINDRFEATGTGWSYDQGAKRIILEKNVRVTFRAEFKNLLK